MDTVVLDSHGHGSGLVLLQVLLRSDQHGVWEQILVAQPEVLDVLLVVNHLQNQRNRQNPVGGGTAGVCVLTLL